MQWAVKLPDGRFVSLKDLELVKLTPLGMEKLDEGADVYDKDIMDEIQMTDVVTVYNTVYEGG